MDDLIEEQVDPVIRFKPESQADEETFFRNNSVYGVFAGEWTVNGVDMQKPINVSAFRTLFKNGIYDVGIDVSFAVGDSEIYQVG